ncbi:MAG: glycosyltransferase family 39 protein [Spartobacteria bacterium]
MPGAADAIQRAVHALEAGGFVVWIRRGLAAVAIAAVAVIYLYHFRGLATSQAMDQAQIGREIARGHGFRTQFVRPRAIAQLQDHGKNVPQRIWTDTYNAPLPPLVDAIALLPVKKYWQMTSRDLVYAGDKAVAAMSILLFISSVVLLFFIARRLFDQRLALLACSLVLVCDSMWQYSLSGLPQMLLLFLFNATIYAFVRAVEAKYGGGRVGLWLALIGVGFALLALTHALTIWMFVAAFVFCFFFFRPRGWAAGIMLAAFLIIYMPWPLRTFIMSGNPAGSAIYSVLDGTGHSEAGWMRKVDLDNEGVGPGSFRDKIANNVIGQTGRIFEYLGWSIVALTFFAALLHAFKRQETNAVQWIILAMWGAAALGMAVFGLSEEQGFAANQLHLIFVPLMTCYGLAYLLVQWNRLGIDIRLARIGFITLLFLLCAFPMLNTLFGMFVGTGKTLVRWPPYIPPYVAVLNSWMSPDEVTASDMPWAIAWYADRPSLWVPDTVKTMTDISDYNVIGLRVNGLYLTPISGSQNTLHDILKGEYRDWASVIQRTIVVEKFPLKWGTLLGLENECVFFSDHDRSKAPAPP